MPVEDRFKQNVIATIAKRAANRCSNPDCGALTSGPTDEPTGAVNVGEAAHIYGANVGSARYNSDMESVERSAITNAIWLCSNCHKMVDDDATRYPAGLLFEWQRNHERRISEQVGKSGAELRHRYELRHLEEFGRLSYLAERLILEKGEAWEYRLTGEVLRFEMAPILRRWDALKRGMYMKPISKISAEDFPTWIATKSEEIQRITGAFSEITNVEFARSWGEPGVPGSDIDIVTTCRLFAEMCQSALEWEEGVRFSRTEEAFADVLSLYAGVGGTLLDEASKLAPYFSRHFGGEITPGIYRLEMILDLPDGWTDAVSAAFAKALRELGVNDE